MAQACFARASLEVGLLTQRPQTLYRLTRVILSTPKCAKLQKMELNPVEIRVLGCLLEKQRTTPEVYPLTLNALRLACNQSTSRDPVVSYDEDTIKEALRRLQRHGLARFTSGHGSRASKYRHLLEEALGLSSEEQAVLCVLMLRCVQTPGELKQRTERMHAFAGLEELGESLERLIEKGLAARLERRPGQKEERYTHLLAGDQPDQPRASADHGQRLEAAPPQAAPPQAAPPQAAPPQAAPNARAPQEALAELQRRVAQLEEDVQSLREEVAR
jgi:uncharacterized protein